MKTTGILFCLLLTFAGCGDDGGNDADDAGNGDATTPSGPDYANGLACERNGDCASGHCQNGFCCDSGDCCAGANDCPEVSADPVCDDAANCQGTRAAASCQNYICETTTVADDSACDVSVVAATCTETPNVTCSGRLAQATPMCTNTCTLETDCSDGFHCDEVTGTCQADLAAGLTCDNGSDCVTGYCNDSICCSGGDCCLGDGDCPGGSHCNEGTFTCEADLGAGATCSDDTDCESGNCDDAPTLCCAFGEECCASPGDCVAAGQSCDVPDTCTGSVETATCTDSACGTETTADPTACQGMTCAGGGTCDAAGACIPPV